MITTHLLVALLALAGTSTARPSCYYCKRLIIDTDFLNFNDDPLALGIANIYQAWGEASILGIASSVSGRLVPPAIDAIDTFYGNPNIPISIHKPLTNITQDPNYPEYGEDYITRLSSHWAHDLRNGEDTPEPVEMYRSILESAAPKSITIVCIGPLDNIYRLFISPRDRISHETGLQLLKSKVRELIIQAAPEGTSFNFYNHNATFARTVINNWPESIKLTFVPGPIGKAAKFGQRLTTELDLDLNPMAYAFSRAAGVNKTASSWDATAMYYAVRGLDDVYSFNSTRGRAIADENATLTWDTSDRSAPNQKSLIYSADGIGPSEFAVRLEDLLLWEPNRRPNHHGKHY